ncbi:vimentin-type intermediate filament-associated coiled-coil protein isoform X1 [Tenrec ecaudatus]|uniref:vimentin-type intermediate filament-associated coiled-coil protein isoform X1 n=1 Tax=Tenrec ecaudatus TaxID=94439 RepID=UPI003F593ED7
MSAPPALQIREANAHLAAMHRRAVELEARLDAAECTVRAQAERLACHDQQLRAALEELGHAKDCEIATLREQLMTSEAAVHNLQATVRQRDDLIGQLQLQAELLRDVCQHRLPLARLLATLDEAERLGSLPSRDPCGPTPAIVSTSGEGRGPVPRHLQLHPTAQSRWPPVSNRLRELSRRELLWARVPVGWAKPTATCSAPGRATCLAPHKRLLNISHYDPVSSAEGGWSLQGRISRGRSVLRNKPEPSALAWLCLTSLPPGVGWGRCLRGWGYAR